MNISSSLLYPLSRCILALLCLILALSPGSVVALADVPAPADHASAGDDGQQTYLALTLDDGRSGSGTQFEGHAVQHAAAGGTVSFAEHIIDTNFAGAHSVYATDLDSDGDVDVLAVGFYADEVAWWENDGSQGFTKHVVDSNFDGAYRVHATDLDLDGDVDILGAARDAGDITWWENDGDENFSEHTIDGSFGATRFVYAADIDKDGDLDVLGTDADPVDDDRIAWWENDGSQTFTRHIIYTLDNDLGGMWVAYPADFDADGDLDVVGATGGAGTVVWLENDGSQGFTSHILSDTGAGAAWVYPTDVDNDGDVDVLGASVALDRVTWWENDGSASFTEHIISNSFNGARHVYAEDVDGDGDVDVLGAGQDANEVAWWENDGNENFTKHTIVSGFDHPTSVYATDVDGDGDVDVISNSWQGNDVAWWEQSSGEDVLGTLEHTIQEPAQALYAIVADWDSDGRNEIVALYGRGDPTAPNGYVAAYEFDGAEYVQEFRLNSPTWRPNIVDVGDVNGDGKNDIVMGTTNGDAGGYIYVISNGSIVWTSNWIGSFRADTGLAVGNTDDDREAEIAVAVNWYGRYLTLYDHVGGNNFTEVFRLYEGDGLSVDIGDIDGDGKNEVVYGMGAWNGRVKAFEFNGVGYSRLWDVQVWYPKRAVVRVGDTDNDGTDEIVIGWGKYTDSRVTIMEGSSVVWWGGPYGTVELPFRPRPAVGSLFNNGRNQIAFAVRRPDYWAIRLVEYDGVTYQEIGVVDRDNTVLVLGESTFIGDADNDGLNELLFVENPGYPTVNDYRISIYTFVVDSPPTADAGGPYSGYEGNPVSLDGSGSTDDTGIALYEWDCTDDGTYDVTSVDPTGTSCTYPDNGSYTVGLRVTDEYGATDESRAGVTVNNVAPAVDAAPDQIVYEDDIVSLAPATFSDPGVPDTHTATIDWGDSSVPEAGVVTESGGSGTVAGTHTYSDPGVYTVMLAVTDDDGGVGTDSMVVTVLHGFLKFCIYAGGDHHSVTIHRQSTVDCSVGSNGKTDINQQTSVAGDVVSLGDMVDLYQEANVQGNVTSADDVELRQRSLVQGNVTSGGDVGLKREATVQGDVTTAGEVRLDRDATVGGTIQEGVYVPPIPPITPVVLSITAGGPDIEVERDGNQTLDPGSYGQLRLKQGATLNLSSGQYAFSRFEADQGAMIHLDLAGGPVVIDVVENLDLRNGVQMEMSGAGTAADVLWRVAGSHVHLHQGGSYLGTFLAPSADIDLYQDTTLEGALYGQRVDVKERVDVTGWPALDVFVSLFLP